MENDFSGDVGRMLDMPLFNREPGTTDLDYPLNFPSIDTEFNWEFSTLPQDLSQPQKVSPFCFPQDPFLLNTAVPAANHTGTDVDSSFRTHDHSVGANPTQTQREIEGTSGKDSAAPQSSMEETVSAQPARFAPPKRPRKQHRSGFRQIPGPNGVVKRGRPSKNAYKLAGVDIDMYALKGVILHGPAKSLDDVQSGELLPKRTKRIKRKTPTNCTPEFKSMGVQTDPIPELPEGISSNAFSEPMRIPNPCDVESQTSDFFLSQGTSSSDRYRLPDVSFESQDRLQNFVLPSDSASSSLNLSSQLLQENHDDGLLPPPKPLRSYWESTLIPGGINFPEFSSFPALKQFSSFPALDPPPEFDVPHGLNHDLNVGTLSYPGLNNPVMVYEDEHSRSEYGNQANQKVLHDFGIRLPLTEYQHFHHPSQQAEAEGGISNGFHVSEMFPQDQGQLDHSHYEPAKFFNLYSI